MTFNRHDATPQTRENPSSASLEADADFPSRVVVAVNY